MPSPARTVPFVALTLCVLVSGACEAGPSAFDRSGGKRLGSGPIPDSVDVSTLPRIPSAVEVEVQSEATDVADSGGEPEEGIGPDGVTARASGAPSESPEGSDPAGEGPDSIGEGSDFAGDVRFPRPDRVRGLYLNAWVAGSRRRTAELFELAGHTEINSFVIDIKDASGYVSHATQLALAREIGATEEIRVRDLPGLLDALEEAGIYPIARIVIAKDPLLSAARPELAVQDSSGGVWVDGRGVAWLNPYSREVWGYHVALAREVAQLGFPEIQWDYVRFPDAAVEYRARATYPGAAGRSKPDAIREFLEHSRDGLADLDVEVTVDVFGITTSVSRDVGIGQVWESFIDVVDVALPMVYPSHYWQGSFDLDSPNAYPYEIVHRALRDALRRSAAVEGAGRTRPWLQDFSLGEPRYGAPEVRAQIQAAYDAGVDEWLLWNPGGHYTVDALEPKGGWVTEPLVRIANEIVPVSRRFELLDRAAIR